MTTSTWVSDADAKQQQCSRGGKRIDRWRARFLSWQTLLAAKKAPYHDGSAKRVPQESCVAKRGVRVQRLDPTARFRYSAARPLRRSPGRLIPRVAADRSRRRGGAPSWMYDRASGRRSKSGFPPVLQALCHDAQPLLRAVALSHQRCPRVPVDSAGRATECRPGCGHGDHTCGSQPHRGTWGGSMTQVSRALPRRLLQSTWIIFIGTRVASHVH